MDEQLAPDEAPDEMSAAQPRAQPSRATHRLRLAWVLFGLLPVALLLTSFALDRAFHGGRALRGVELSGMAVGGMDRAALEAVCRRLQDERSGVPVAVRIDGQRFELLPRAVSYHLRIDLLVQRALHAGREGGWPHQLLWWLGRFGSGHTIALEGVLDAGALAAQLGRWGERAIDEPPFEGAVEIRDGHPVARLPYAGEVVDQERGRGLLLERIARPTGEDLTLPLLRREPRHQAAAVAQAVAEAVELLSGPVVLLADPPPAMPQRAGGAGSPAHRVVRPVSKAKRSEQVDPLRFTFEPAVLAGALRSKPVETERPALALYFDPTALGETLAQARKTLEHPPIDARFVVDRRDEVHIEPALQATVIEPAKVAQALLVAARSAERSGRLPVTLGAWPGRTTAAAEALGIKGLVAKFTTRHPCCRPRVNNIHRIADLVDGVVLAPGERFSINERVGPRTTRLGFVPAPTIVHGKMKDTVGGGVSQFATTFFNAAFYGGYEIVERQPHSYYFSRYPMGHEATLSYPKPDVIIRNDSAAGLLIRTFYTSTSITVKLYGDNGGRKVRREVSRPRDFTDPPVEYIADRTREPDEEKVVARGRKGWTVIAARITRYPDGHEKREQRKVVYQPRVRKVKVHPCKIPEGEKGHTGEPCPKPVDEDADRPASEAPAVDGYDPREQVVPEAPDDGQVSPPPESSE